MSPYNSRKDIKKMIDNYVAGTATDEEIKFVESYYAFQERNETLQQSDEEQEQLRSAIFKNIIDQTQLQHQTKPLKWYRYAAAAAVLLTFALSGGYLLLRQKDAKTALVAVHAAEIAPGGNKAILTLENGEKVILDDKSNNELKKTKGLTITKTRKGELVYTASATQLNQQRIANNTVTTPKGGQYRIILPDGTKVWLNAASSLTYPELFTGNQRIVKLQGEGYFEVAKNKTMPFHVETAGQDVEVTGTHFNVNGYMDDNAVKTTLLEGSVNVHSGGRQKTITPGEQALVFNNPLVIEVKNVDTDEEVAWKNELFEFNNASLKNILIQLERWYDVQINYNNLPQKRFNGVISRNANLSDVLKMLELTGNIKFQVDANRHLKVTGN